MYDELIKRLRATYEADDITNQGILLEAADAIEELSKERDNWKATAKEERDAYWHWFDQYQKDVPKWIPVTERLPRDRQFVLVYCGDNKRIRPSDRFDVAILLGDSIFTSLGVTHWMPLPEPPKEET